MTLSSTLCATEVGVGLSSKIDRCNFMRYMCVVLSLKVSAIFLVAGNREFKSASLIKKMSGSKLISDHRGT